MERFVSHQNIELYRKLADLYTDETQRRLIFDLLAEEQEKFRQTRETLQCPL
jgi:rubrerythrin